MQSLKMASVKRTRACILTDSGVSVLLGGVVEVMVEWVMDLLCVRGELLSCLFSLLLLDELSLLTSFSSAGISSQYLNMHTKKECEIYDIFVLYSCLLNTKLEYVAFLNNSCECIRAAH